MALTDLFLEVLEVFSSIERDEICTNELITRTNF